MNKNQKPKTKSQKLKTKRCVVLLSGGLDSAVTLYQAKAMGYETYALTFDYGQRHKKEIAQAKEIAASSASKWQLVNISLPWKGSSLLDRKQPLPKNRKPGRGIPSTYVPARNMIFLSFAASFAEAITAEAVFIGANQIDYSGYPDCRLGFLKLFEKTLKTGTKRGAEGKKIEVIAPLIRKNKAQIVQMARRLGVPIELTWSCYQGGSRPCGVCDSCLLREWGFNAANLRDSALCR